MRRLSVRCVAVLAAVLLGACSSEAGQTTVPSTPPVASTPVASADAPKPSDGPIRTPALRAVPTGSPPARLLDGVPMAACTVNNAPARCGTLRVAEDRSTPGGRQIDLRVVVYPATVSPKADPIVFLAGGPGGSAVDSYGYALTAFSRLHRDHDFVLLDQRGTGESGAVRLPMPPDMTGLTQAESLARAKEWLAAALATLPADPRHYTSWIAADDLDQVRAALGYDQVNLFGGSYGATMAQVYLAAHPEHVRTVTLTGVSLLDVHLFEHTGRAAQEILDKVLARCDADPACHAAYPDIHGDFARAWAAVRAKPVTTRVTNPSTGQAVTFDVASFGATVELMTASVETAAALPRAIHHAAGGDWDPLARIAVDQYQAPESGTALLAMAITIRCSEGWATWDPATTAKESEGSYEAAQVNALARQNAALCSAWPKADVPAADRQPVRSDVPVLLLVGGSDPADPPENAADAPVELPNSVTAVFPAGGHCVETYGCAPQLMSDFIAAGTAKGLDVSCAAEAPVPPFNVLP